MDQLAKACPVPVIGGFGGGSEDTSEAAMSEDEDDDEDEDEAMEEGMAAGSAMEVLPEESGVKNKKTSRVRTTISDEQVSLQLNSFSSVRLRDLGVRD